MTEYALQKRTLSMWSYVTWYDDLSQAKANFDKVSKDSGYSWRIVELKVLHEAKLDGELKDEPPEQENITGPVNVSWGDVPLTNKKGDRIPTPNQFLSREPAEPIKTGWGVPSTSWGDKLTSEPDLKNAHPSKGQVWVGNPATKEKKRVPAVEAESMMKDGWIKTGPRTVL